MTQTLTPSAPPASVFLTPFSVESELVHSVNNAAVTPTSAVYASANRAFYFPIVLRSTIVVNRFFWCNGTTAGTNNIQVGVYDNAGNTVKLGTSTLASGTSQPQFDNVTDFPMTPGRYYLAFWCNGTTTHLLRSASVFDRLRSCGILNQASLTGGLPSTTTFAALVTSYVPLFGLALRASP